MYKLIKKENPRFPNSQTHDISISPLAKDFINKCLKKDPMERLGSEGGLKEILNHPWFGEFDYDTMLKKEYEAEYKPKLSDNMFDV